MPQRVLHILIISVTLLAPLPVMAEPLPPQPTISIVIDDLGNQWGSGVRAVQLPGEVTYAILPFTPYSKRLARLAHLRGRELMLHFPMASMRHLRPGPGAVDTAMDRKHFLKQAEANLAAVPFIRGVNNHMGSQVTASMPHMQWLMDELAQRGDLFFVDSMTTHYSVAAAMANESGVPTIKRDVFLDNEREPKQIHAQFQRLLRLAKMRGYALAIGHPYPETLALLEQELPHLAEQGIRLVAVSRLIQSQQIESPVLWQASLSPSQTDLKN